MCVLSTARGDVSSESLNVPWRKSSDLQVIIESALASRERQSELMCTRDVSPSSELGGVHVLLGSAKIHILLIPQH